MNDKIESGAGDTASIRIKAFNLTFTDGVATMDLSSYSEGKAFGALCLAVSQVNASIVVTSAVISNSVITVKAKNIASSPTAYNGTVTMDILFFLK